MTLLFITVNKNSQNYNTCSRNLAQSLLIWDAMYEDVLLNVNTDKQHRTVSLGSNIVMYWSLSEISVKLLNTT